MGVYGCLWVARFIRVHMSFHECLWVSECFWVSMSECI